MATDPKQDPEDDDSDFVDEYQLEKRRNRLQVLRQERAERSRKMQKRKRLLLLLNFVVIIGTTYYFLNHFEQPGFYKTVNRVHDGTGLRLSIGKAEDGDYIISFAVTNRAAAGRTLVFNGALADFSLASDGVPLETIVIDPGMTAVPLKPGITVARSLRVEKWRIKKFARSHADLARRPRVLFIPIGRVQLPLRAEVRYRLAGAPVLRIDFTVEGLE